MGGRAAPPRGGEPVADLHALDRLDPHQRGGEPRVQPAVAVHVRAEPRRQAVDEYLHDAAQRVAVLLGRIDLGDHGRGRFGAERPNRRLVDRAQIRGRGQRSVGRVGRPERHHVGQHLGTQHLVQEAARDRAERHP